MCIVDVRPSMQFLLVLIRFLYDIMLMCAV